MTVQNKIGSLIECHDMLILRLIKVVLNKCENDKNSTINALNHVIYGVETSNKAIIIAAVYIVS